MVVIILILVLLASGLGSIYIMYLRAEREKMNSKLKLFLSPGFVPWKVDKQMVEKTPDNSNSLDIVLYANQPVPNGRPLYPDLKNPRQVRVTITNRTQVKHIGDFELEDEEGILRAVAEAEEQISFLNAHKVK